MNIHPLVSFCNGKYWLDSSYKVADIFQYVHLVLELAMSLLDFSPRIPLGTFSILLSILNLHLRIKIK